MVGMVGCMCLGGGELFVVTLLLRVVVCGGGGSGVVSVHFMSFILVCVCSSWW